MKNRIIHLLTIFSITFITTLICPTSSAITFNQITAQKLQHWSYLFDYTYRFIILNQELVPHLQRALPVRSNIEYYVHSCKENSTILRTCSHKNTDIVLIYNKIPIEFEVYIEHLTIQQISADAIVWMKQVMDANFRRNLNEEKILGIIKKSGDVFILVENKTILELEKGFDILSKEFYFKDFVYLSDISLAESLGLQIGNYLHVKNALGESNFEAGDLVRLIKNQSCTAFLPKQIQPRYDYLKMFVLENIFGSGFNKNMLNVEEQRFNLKMRSINQKGESQNKRNVIVFCDLSKDCLKLWRKLDIQILQHNQGNSDSIFRRFFYRAQSSKYLAYIEVFFHIRLNNKKIPYFVVLDGQDPSNPNLPLRFIKQFSIKDENPFSTISIYLEEVDHKKYENVRLTSGIPKKNGFTGKGSEKHVQKLSFQTYKQVLQEAKAKKRFYLLFITAFQFDCAECTKFYNEFRKLASFLDAQQSLDVTLGVYDLSKDQIDLPYLNNIPSLFLFSPSQKEPVQYQSRYQFEFVLNFLKKQISIQKNSQKQVKVQNAQEL